MGVPTDRPLTIADLVLAIQRVRLSALSIEFIDLRTPSQRQDDLQRWLGQIECLGGHLWGLQWLVDDPVSCVRCGAAV